MPQIINLQARQFNRWRVISLADIPGRRKFWRCECTCGTIANVAAGHLLSGASQSCGCLRKEASSAANKTHGQSETPTYAAWSRMRDRCLNPNNPKYPRYGGRGITVCARWSDYEAFLADMGEKPEGRFSIDRKDNDGGYSPENCRWATDQQQARNKSNTRILALNGVSKTLTSWAKDSGIGVSTLWNRLNKGLSLSEALPTFKD